MNQAVCGKRKIFWKEVNEARSGMEKKCRMMMSGRGISTFV